MSAFGHSVQRALRLRLSAKRLGSFWAVSGPTALKRRRGVLGLLFISSRLAVSGKLNGNLLDHYLGE